MLAREGLQRRVAAWAVRDLTVALREVLATWPLCERRAELLAEVVLDGGDPLGGEEQGVRRATAGLLQRAELLELRLAVTDTARIDHPSKLLLGLSTELAPDGAAVFHHVAQVRVDFLGQDFEGAVEGFDGVVEIFEILMGLRVGQPSAQGALGGLWNEKNSTIVSCHTI